MNIYFDLDGTLIDSSQRLYNLFIDLSGVKMSFEDYWEMKKNKVRNEEILINNFFFSEKKTSFFTKCWMDNIEDWEYLKKDNLFDFTIKTLEYCQMKSSLFVVTNRQSVYKTEMQLDFLNISSFFKKIFVTEHKKTKIDLLKEANVIISSSDIVIGDTGADVVLGKAFNTLTISVLSGFRNRERLESYNPDLIVDNILELTNMKNL